MAMEDPQNKVILATGGYDHAIHCWQAHTGACQRSFQHTGSQVNCMEITPNRQLLAAAGFQHIRMYDIFSNNPNPVVKYDGVSKNVTSVGFQEDGRWMFTGSEDNAARVWDLRSRALQCQRIFNANFPVNCVCLHPNQSELYIGDQGGTIYVWDLAQSDKNEAMTKQPFFKATEPDVSIQSIDIDSEGTSMAAVDNKGNCYFFTLNLASSTGNDNNMQPKHRLKLKAHQLYALKCKFSPDSTLLATTSADCTAKLWRTSDINNPQPSSPSASQSQLPEISPCSMVNNVLPMMELKSTNQRWVWDVAFSADSQYIFTASSDNLARLWSVSTGEVKREYNGHSKALTSIAFKDGS